MNVEVKDSYSVVEENYKVYGYNSNRERVLASPVDGLKLVYRRMIWTTLQYDRKKYVSSSTIVGKCIEIHPHGEQDGVLYSLVNSKLKIFDKQGNFGGPGIAGSASRYTSCKASSLMDLYLGQDLINYVNMIDGESDIPEPEYLPTLIPYILVEGNSMMGTGISSSIPSLNVLDLIDYYKEGLKGTEDTDIRLDIGKCRISSDVKSLSDSIKSGAVSGYRFHPIIELEGSTAVLNSVPPNMNFSKIEKVFNPYIESDDIDFRNESNAEERYVWEAVGKVRLDELMQKVRNLSSTVSYNLFSAHEEKLIYSRLSYWRKCTLDNLKKLFNIRKSSNSSKLNSRLRVMEVIKYMKDNDLVKELQNKSKEEFYEILPFDQDDINKAFGKSISVLLKGYTDAEIDEIKKEIEVVDNESAEDYISKLYDDFRKEIEKVYKSQTEYGQVSQEGEEYVVAYTSGWVEIIKGDFKECNNILKLDKTKKYILDIVDNQYGRVAVSVEELIKRRGLQLVKFEDEPKIVYVDDTFKCEEGMYETKNCLWSGRVLQPRYGLGKVMV